VVVALTALVGLLDIAFGILLIVQRNEVTITGLDASGVLVAGVFEILIGVFVLVVARALSWGSNVARWLIVVLMGLRVIAGVAAIGASPGIQRGQHVVVALIGVLVIVLLLTPRAAEFFRANRFS
jgi:hypothetical protein